MIELFPASDVLKRVSDHWFLSRDGDDSARLIFDRHYSRYHYADGRKPKLFVGPGEKIVLVSANYDALFVWRKFIDASGQQGVNCMVFRNESKFLSSVLIREADEVAWGRWPSERLYTYVKTGDGRGDGCCFKKAGYRKCGRTKVNRLIILEKIATPAPRQGEPTTSDPTQ